MEVECLFALYSNSKLISCTLLSLIEQFILYILQVNYGPNKKLKCTLTYMMSAYT